MRELNENKGIVERKKKKQKKEKKEGEQKQAVLQSNRLRENTGSVQ